MCPRDMMESLQIYIYYIYHWLGTGAVISEQSPGFCEFDTRMNQFCPGYLRVAPVFRSPHQTRQESSNDIGTGMAYIEVFWRQLSVTPLTNYPETTPIYFDWIIYLIMYCYRERRLSANATAIMRLGASRPRLSIQGAPVLYRNLELLPIEKPKWSVGVKATETPRIITINV